MRKKWVILKDKANLSDMKVSDINKTTENMFKKLRRGDALNENETKLFDSYVDYLDSIGQKLGSDFRIKGQIEKKIRDPGDLDSSIPRNFRKFKKTKKFKDLISFNTIQQGNDTTNIAIDDSNTLAMFGGGSSINMIELNGYMSV